MALVFLALIATAGCATTRRDFPISATRAWASPIDRAHPLVGRIRDVEHGRWIESVELVTALAAADFVLLGETHDNLDHHLLQAELVRAIVAVSGRRPALAFEMIDRDRQPALDAALASDASPESASAAVDWSASGWPAFAIYRPIFAAGLEARLHLVGANLSNREAREIMRRGLAAVPPDVLVTLESAPLAPALADEWATEMAEAHCGALPEKVLEPMVLAQRARDLELADNLVTAAGTGAAILIAGAGHVRTDRAVPAWIERFAPGRSNLAVALREVGPDLPAEPDDADFPFDFVVFTPRAERPDPCEAFRRQPSGP